MEHEGTLLMVLNVTDAAVLLLEMKAMDSMDMDSTDDNNNELSDLEIDLDGTNT